MSVVDGSRLANSGRQLVWLAGLRRWAFWSTPRPFKIYVLVINAAALTVIAATATMVPLTRHDVVLFLCLAAGSVVHLEATKRVERLRELATQGRAYTNFKSVWSFAGLLLLPPPLVAALIMLTYLHMWCRMTRRIPPYRWVFGAGNAILATAAAGVVLVLAFPDSYPGLPAGLVGVVVVAAAAATRWAVNTMLLGVFFILQARALPVREAFGLGGDDFIEAGSLGLGLLTAFLLVHDPFYLLALAIPLMVVHRGLLLPQLEYAAQRDRDTGLYTSALWHELAGKQFERASQSGGTVGVIMITVDRYRTITRECGASVGVQVLRRVADTLRVNLRTQDLAARQSDKDFAILLPDLTLSELTEVAQRLLDVLDELVIEIENPDGPVLISELEVSVGGARYPDDAGTLPELLIAADNAVFSAQGDGQNHVVIMAG